MKSSKFKKRFYRDFTKISDLHKLCVSVKESDIQVLADRPLDKDFIEGRIKFYRSQIESYIGKDAKFLSSLKPITVELRAPAIVKRMAKAAKESGVGPMAAVAGAIAEYLGRDLLSKGYKEVIVENGGDIFIKIIKTRKIGIYSGKSKSCSSLNLKINPKNTPMGICTSSGTIGHSLSFGLAQSVVILAQDAILADAVATASCNLVQSKQTITKALDFLKSIKGVSGGVIIFAGNLGSWGKVEFIK